MPAAARAKEILHYATIPGPLGPLLLAASARGLTTLHFARDSSFPPRSEHYSWIESPPHLARYAAQLAEYFAGNRRNFDLPLDLRGTDFQLRCWRELLRIPYGQTRSYAKLAHAAGAPAAVRAVGAANGANPIAIIVPCHRVIASNGTLHGYGGGLDAKAFLLRLEGALGQDQLHF